MARYVARNYRLTRIYASTLKRAAQTARHLSDETGTAIEFDPDLIEFNNGLLAGLSRKDADRLYPYVENLPNDQAMYGQESMVEFRNRAVNVLQKVLSENSSEAVVRLRLCCGTQPWIPDRTSPDRLGGSLRKDKADPLPRGTALPTDRC